MATFQPSDLKILEGSIAETERRIERLSGVDEPTNRDIANLEAARQDLSMHEETMRQARVQLTGKPGPAKMFPIRFELRISKAEENALGRISRDTGEDRSEIIRRLLREADPRL